MNQRLRPDWRAFLYCSLTPTERVGKPRAALLALLCAPVNWTETPVPQGLSVFDCADGVALVGGGPCGGAALDAPEAGAAPAPADPPESLAAVPASELGVPGGLPRDDRAPCSVVPKRPSCIAVATAASRNVSAAAPDAE